MRLTIQLPVLIAAVIGVVIVASGMTLTHIGSDALKEQVLKERQSAAQQLSNFLVTEIQNGVTTLTNTGSQILLSGPSEVRREIAEILGHSHYFQYLTLLSPEGKVVALEPSSLEESLSHRTFSHTPWINEVRRTAGAVVSELHISPATQEPTLVIAVPLYLANGQMKGIWAGGLNLQELQKTIFNNTPETSNYLTDRRGLVIAHSKNPSFTKNQTDFSSIPAVGAALAGKNGTLEFDNQIVGERTLAAYLPLTLLGGAVISSIPTAIAYRPLQDLANGGLLISGVLAVFAISLSIFMARRLVAPISALTQATQTISKGDLNHPIQLQGSDEFKLLGAMFNQMRLSLTQKDALLQKQADDLSRSNAELTQFAYIASHDLQEPLRMVSGHIKLLERRLDDKLDPQTREFMGYAVDGAQRMQGMIDDILTYSRVNNSDQPFGPVDSQESFKEATKRLASLISSTGAVVLAQGLPVVHAQGTQLVQLFQNLLSNAIKFRGKKSPQIQVEARLEADHWRFSVSDNGIGIDPQYQQRIFNIFQRLHTIREYPGNGIGLAICLSIVKRHGGQIGVESKLGGGSIFWFTLPTAKDCK